MKSYALMEQYARWESGGAPSGTPTRSGLETRCGLLVRLVSRIGRVLGVLTPGCRVVTKQRPW